MRAQLRKTHSIVRPVSQVNLRIRGEDQEEAFRNARQAVLAWMSNRAGRKLPDSAWRGESFELVEVGAQNTAAIAIDQPLYWTARLDDADKDIPMRVWTTEIAIAAETERDVVFGARLINVTRGDDAPSNATLGIKPKSICTSAIRAHIPSNALCSLLSAPVGSTGVSAAQPKSRWSMRCPPSTS